MRNRPSEGIRSIARNAGQVFSARLLTQAVRAIYVVILARYLGPELYGLLAYCQSWYISFLPLSLFGVGAYVAREVGRGEREGASAVADTLVVRLGATLAATLACAMAGWFANADGEVRALLLVFSLALAGRALGTWTQGLFIAYQKSAHTLRQEAFFRPAELLLGVLVMLTGGGAMGIAVVHAAMWWLQGMHGLFTVRTRIAPTLPPVNLRSAARAVMVVIPLSLGPIFMNWLLQGPIVMLRHTAESEVASLALALQFLGMAIALPVAIGGAALPLLSKAVDRSDRRLLDYAENMMRASVLTGAIAGMFGTTLGPWLLTSVLGDRFLAAGELLGPALWLLAPYGVALAANPVLIATGRHFASATQAAIGAAAMTLTAVVIGSRFGPEGLLACAALGMFLWAAGQTAALRYVSGLNTTKALVRPLLASLLGAAVFYGSGVLSPLAALPAGLSALVVGVAAFRVIGRNEWNAARSRLGWRN